MHFTHSCKKNAIIMKKDMKEEIVYLTKLNKYFNL